MVLDPTNPPKKARLKSSSRCLTESQLLAEHIKENLHHFVISDEMFEKSTVSIVDDSEVEMMEFPFFVHDDNPNNSTNVKLNPEISNKIPPNSSGIYVFVAKPKAITSICYPAYVGKAEHRGKTHDIITRIKTYESKYRNDSQPRRMKFDTMFEYWRNHLYLQVFIFKGDDLNDINEKVCMYENELISSILPLFNTEIKNVVVKNAVNITKIR